MKQRAINLNVFSNVASQSSGDCLAPATIRSFLSCFPEAATEHDLIIRIFIDPNPNPSYFANWVEAIAQGLPDLQYEIVQTTGHSDGFWRSVQISEGDYAIQLEHDWMFISSRIKHRLSEIIEDMRTRRINYLRFNKRRNVQFGTDYFLENDDFGQIPLCRISGRSNNPQIIEIGYYRSLLQIIGSNVGLEGSICKYAGGGYVYGPAGWPRTVQHLDGRHARMKDNIARFYYLTLAKSTDWLRPPGWSSDSRSSR